ncbi:MAG: hypothetical protein RL380_1211 [Verrucomicrobiota bacterium]
MKSFSRFAAIVSLGLTTLTVAAAPQKLRVDDPAVAESLRARGAKVIADYGAFQLLEADTPQLSPREQAHTQTDADADFIELHASRLDTRTAAVRAQRTARGTFSGSRLHLVQFAGPIKPEWRGELEATGARVVDYIPNNAYLIYGNAKMLARIQAWAGTNAVVQWEGSYADSYKVHPVARTNFVTKSGRHAPTPTGYTVQLVNDPIANAATRAVIDGLKRGAVIRESAVLDYVNISAAIPAERLDELAAQPDVISILPYYAPHKLDERQDQIIAGALTNIFYAFVTNVSGGVTNITALSNGVPSGAGYLAWLASKGFTNSQFTNFVVDVADDGVDNGTTNVGHFALFNLGDPTLGSRVIYSRLALGTNASGSTTVGTGGHGNLNAHIVGGYDDQTGLKVHTDAQGFHYGLGVCPFAKLGSTVIFDSLGSFFMTNFVGTLHRAYTNGVRISNNSWGGGYFGVYDVDSQIYDTLTRDSATNAGNQEMTYVFAAGNDGPDIATVTSPGTAKNVIVVGAGENVFSFAITNGGNNTNGLDGCDTSDLDANNANDVSYSSSSGPCNDGRLKPDIMAPGTHITGGVPQNGTATTNGTGVALTTFTGNAVCGLVGSGTNAANTNNYFPLGQKFWTTSTGTSHAAPAVSGACALIRQYFINQGRTNPSPALTKGFLMNAGRYMTGGNVTGDSLPSYYQGMGEVNLGNAFDGITRIIRDQVDVFTNSGATRVITGSISDSTKPLRITLAWTDAPGSTSGNAYKNDLDLIVTLGGQTYYGNWMAGTNAVLNGVADKKNNVESVYFPAGLTGNFTITVLAANINSDGIPNVAPTIDQDFALIAYNATSNAAPAPAISSVTLVSETCAPTNNAIDAGETVTIAVAFTNASGTATTNLTVSLLTSNGVTGVSAAQNYGALTNGGAAVSKQFTFTAPSAAVCGGTFTGVFQLLDSSVNYGTPTKTLRVGNIVTNVYSYTNTTTLNCLIPSTGTGPGSAKNYPVTNRITGFTGTVAKVTVTLRGLAHTYASDIDALLVAPDGTNMCMLISDAANAPSTSRSMTVTLDDDADLFLPSSGALSSFTYIPVNYNGDTNTVTDDSDVFAAPAPAPPGGGFYSDWLTNFIGVNPNGTWNLYLRDDYSGDSGTLASGYIINLYTITTNCGSCAVATTADLAVSQTAAPASTYTNNNVTFTLTVTNLGSSAASSVVVSNTLPTGLNYVSATPPANSTNGNTYAFALGSLASAGATNVTLTAKTTTTGNFTNTAAVSSATTDPVPSNNSATAAVTVVTIPAIASVSTTNSTVTLAWSALPNVTYRVQYKTNLLQASWLDLTGNITTSGSSLTTNLPVTGTQRFYRITALP